MQVEVFNSIVNNSFDDSHRARVILPRRYGGCAPGVSPIAPAAYLAAVIHFWKFRVWVESSNWDWSHELFVFFCFLADRILSRSSVPRALFTETEEELIRASERINEAAVNHPHLNSRTRPEVKPLNGFVQGEPLSGPAAEALLRVGVDPEAQSTPSDFRPVLFESLYTMKASKRSLVNFLWVDTTIMFGLQATKFLGLHWMKALQRVQPFFYKAYLQAHFSVLMTEILGPCELKGTFF